MQQPLTTPLTQPFTVGMTSPLAMPAAASGSPPAPIIPLVSPSANWSGTAGSGWSGDEPTATTSRATSDPARPILTPFQPDMQAITGDEVLHCMAYARNGASVEGVASVDVLFEGSTVNIPAMSVNDIVGEDGVTRQAMTWAFQVDHSAFSMDGWARYYLRANPIDGTMNARTIGPYYLKRVSRADWFEVDLTFGSGGTYTDMYAAVSQAKTEAVAGKEHIRVRPASSHTYDLNSHPSGFSTGTAFTKNGVIRIEALPGVDFTIMSSVDTDVQDWAAPRPFISGLEFKNVKFDMENIFQFVNETGYRTYVLRNVEVTDDDPVTPGRNKLPGGKSAGSKTPRNNTMFPQGSHWLECEMHDTNSGPQGRLVRWSKFYDNSGDQFSQSANSQYVLNFGNECYGCGSAFIRTNLDSITVSAAGYTTATVKTTGSAGTSGRALTLTLDGVDTVFSLSATPGVGVYTMQDLVTALNAVTGITATLVDNTRAACGIGGVSNLAVTNILDTTLTIGAAFDVHTDLWQYTGGVTQLENVLILCNLTYNNEGIQGYFVEPASRDLLFANNTIGAVDGSVFSQTNLVASHVMLVHNTWHRQGFSASSGFNPDTKAMMAGNVFVSAVFNSGVDNDIAVVYNHFFTGTAPGGTGTANNTFGGTTEDLTYPDAEIGDFTPAPGSTIDGQSITPFISFDLAMTLRGSSTHQGAIH